MAKRLVFPRNLFVRHPEQDFGDDGNYFRVVYYKDALPITCCKYEEDVFVSIRPDYLRYKWEQYKADDRLLDKYNGVARDEFDMADFIEVCEKMYQKYCLKVVEEEVKEVEPKEDKELTAEDGIKTMLQGEHDRACEEVERLVGLIHETTSFSAYKKDPASYLEDLKSLTSKLEKAINKRNNAEDKLLLLKAFRNF